MGVCVYGLSTKYAYSNTRVKSMEFFLIKESQMATILSSKDNSTILSTLMQTDYSKSLSDFGGISIKQSLIDFALSKNLAEHIIILLKITPPEDKSIILSIIGRWDLHNLRLAIEAKGRNLPYEQISRYVIDYGEFNHLILKEALKEDNLEKMFQHLSKKSPHYSKLINVAEKSYLANKNIYSAISAMDISYYKLLEKTIALLFDRKERATRILRKEIDSRNILTLILAKSKNKTFNSFQENIISRGYMDLEALRKVYDSSDSIEALSSKITVFDLKGAAALYKKNKRLLSFEVAMKNAIFNMSKKAITQSVLCLTSIISYVYLKEIEVSTLRILIKGKEYGLTKDELSELMIWKGA